MPILFVNDDIPAQRSDRSDLNAEDFPTDGKEVQELTVGVYEIIEKRVITKTISRGIGTR